MTIQPANKLKSAEPQVRHTHRDNWEVMKPFVHFSFKTIKIIGITLVAVVKAVLSLRPSPKRTDTTVIKR